jgi:hypothetical protein
MSIIFFSAKHWQQIEAGRPICARTLFLNCEVFETHRARMVFGLDKGMFGREGLLLTRRVVIFFARLADVGL